jgi:DNA-binding NarL/FixJ family response regulator
LFKQLPNTNALAEAQDGAQALVLAQNQQPDLKLLDIVMHGMSGLDVARVVQTLLRVPPVPFLSRHDNASYSLAALALGTLGLVSMANFVTELLPNLAGLAATTTGVSS